MICGKCNSENIGIRLDKRNIAEFYCKDCGSGVKKASSAELVERLLAQEEVKETPGEVVKNTVPCRYCTEEYFFRLGRMGNQYIKAEIAYCPMCGRKLSTIDRSW